MWNSVWFLPFSTFLRFTRLAACTTTSFIPFISEWHFVTCLSCILFSSSFMDGHLGSFHHVVIVNSAAMNRNMETLKTFICRGISHRDSTLIHLVEITKVVFIQGKYWEPVQGIDLKEDLNCCVILAVFSRQIPSVRLMKHFSIGFRTQSAGWIVEEELWSQNRSDWTVGMSYLALSCLKCGHST